MSVEELDFDRDMGIDEDNLDKEWLHQPTLMMRYSRALVDADDEVRRLIQQEKAVRSELSLEAQQEGTLPKGVKPTAGNVEAYFRDHSKHREIKDDLREAEREAALMMQAVFAIRMRKDALESLVRLHGQNYFAGPTTPRDLNRDWDRKVAETEEDGRVATLDRVHEKMNKRSGRQA